MKRWMGVSLVAVSAMGFGLMSSLERLAQHHGVNLLTLLSFRFLIAFFVLLLIGLMTNQRYHLSIKVLFILSLLGIFGYAAMAFLLFSSYQHLPASIATIIFYTYPLLTYVFSILLKYEDFKIRKAAVYAFCLGGLLISIYSGGKMTTIGILLAFGAGLIYSIFILVSNTLVKEIPSLVSSTIICFTSGLTLLVLGAVKHQVSMQISLHGWAIIFTLALLSTVIPIVFFFNGIKIIGAANGALVSTIEPVTSIILSLFLFHDLLNGIQVLGIIVVLASTMVTQFKPLLG
jgi:drug/metabolite transporter (DMT)-like permease